MNNETFIRAARNLIETHGEAAADIAERRARSLAVSGATMAADSWRRIANHLATGSSCVGPAGLNNSTISEEGR